MKSFLCALAVMFVSVTFCAVKSQSIYAAEDDAENYFEVCKQMKTVIESTNDRGIDGFQEKLARWEHTVGSRALPSGNLEPMNRSYAKAWEFMYHHQNELKNRNRGWYPLESESSFTPGSNAGRINSLAFHPTDSNTIFIGAPAGGLWKSTDAGKSWISLTSQIPSIGVGDIVVNPNNVDEIYIATGDRDAAYFISNPYSFGILKSNNGGKTWDTSGLQFMASHRMSITRLIMHPNNSEILYAAVTSAETNYKGLWKTTDGGKKWTNINGGAKYDVEFHPNNPSIIYTSGYKNVQRSLDGGLTWQNLSTYPGMPATSDYTISHIAVTPAEPEAVFLVFVDGVTKGIYKSSDHGERWRVLNKFSLNTQGGYDFDFAVSQIDTQNIVLGGQLMAVSVNGGKTMLTRSEGHVDHHAFYFRRNSNLLFDCNDGGIYASSNMGQTWINLNKGLSVMQYYRIASSGVDSTFILGGAQDNGSLLFTDGKRQMIFGADGMYCAIDPKDPEVYYTSYQYGNLIPWGPHAPDFTSPPNAGSNSYSWVAPFVIHPTKPERIFIAGKDIFTSEDYGANWTNYSTNLTASDNVGGGTIRSMAISSSDPDHYMYATSYVVVYKTSDGGKNWQIVTSNLPVSAGCFDCSALSSIVIDPDDPEHLWVTISGYSVSNRVFESLDGGKFWNNISFNLPAVPVNCLVVDKVDKQTLYIGTDIGVFKRDSFSSHWDLWMDGMPIVPVQQLELLGQFRKLRAATFGRGLWEMSLNQGVISQVQNGFGPIDLSVWPDPLNRQIVICNLGNNSPVIFSLFSINGGKIMEEILHSETSRIDLPKPLNGLYLYSLMDKNLKKLVQGKFFMPAKN
ncbi:MAG: hypothetical protein U0V49_10015 [Saprospiraceae bacterium]